MKEVIRFESNDGKLFNTEAQCRHYETIGKAGQDFDDWYNDMDGIAASGSQSIIPANELREWLISNQWEVMQLLDAHCGRS